MMGVSSAIGPRIAPSFTCPGIAPVAFSTSLAVSPSVASPVDALRAISHQPPMKTRAITIPAIIRFELSLRSKEGLVEGAGSVGGISEVPPHYRGGLLAVKGLLCPP